MTAYDFWVARLMPKLAERRRLARLAKWLTANPISAAQVGPPTRTASFGSLIRWDRWPEVTPAFRRSDAGWWQLGEQGHSFGRWPHPLTPLTKCSVVDWKGSFSDIDGLSGSKSPLEAFADLDEFARARCPKWITPATQEQLAWCLDHKPIDEWRANGATMFLADWDQRIFLLNSDGSHHFAAARYLAKELEVLIDISGELKHWALCLDALSRLKRQYALFCLCKSSLANWREFAALAHIPYGLLDPPRPLEGFFVLAVERISLHQSIIELLETHELREFESLLNSLVHLGAKNTSA